MLLALFVDSAVAGAPSIDEPWRSGGSAPDDVALVIGNEDYGFIPDVPYARRDAQAFYDFLVYTRGVPLDRIRLLQDKPREVIETAVADLSALAKPGGTFWMYYAGHGAADPSTGQRLLLGNDVQRDASVFVGRGVPVDQLQASAARAGAQVITVIDACFNGAGRDGAAIISGKRFAVPAYAVQSAGVSEWAATGPEQLASPLHAVRHGAFTWFAIGALRGWADGEIDGHPDGTLTMPEAQAWVVRNMRAAQLVEQAPTLSAGTGALVLVGESAHLEAAPSTEEIVAAVRPASLQPTSPSTPPLAPVPIVAAATQAPVSTMPAQAAQPVMAPAPAPSGVVQISCGQKQACTIDVGGSLRCWGGTPPPGGAYQMVSVGDEHACALDDAGQIVCWGSDRTGAVSNAPAGVFEEIASSGPDSCARSEDGLVSCWGYATRSGAAVALRGRYSALGDGLGCFIDTKRRLACSPGGTEVLDVRMTAPVAPNSQTGRPWSAPTVPVEGVAVVRNARIGHLGCALLADRTVSCWGANERLRASPAGTFQAITSAAGSFNTFCGLTTSGTVGCWGDNPALVQGAPSQGPYVAIDGGHDFACALSREGAVNCWGSSLPAWLP